MEKQIQELHAIFKGKVQGVGFRWTIAEHAEICSLKGTVKNLTNGTVEVYAQGTRENLEKFLNLIQQEPGNAQIISFKKDYRNSSENFTDFHIL